jgi:peptide chain release factor subunit 1
MIDNLHRLAQINTHPFAVASLYLALDQSREARLQTVNNLIKRKEQELGGNGAKRLWREMTGDIDRMLRFVGEMPAGPDRGLAMFCCQAAGVFETLPLSLPAPNLLEVGPSPYIRPLAVMVGDHGPTLIVILDSRRARFLRGLMGTFAEDESLTIVNQTDLPERDGDQGRATDKRLSRRGDEAVGRHFKQVNAQIMALSKKHGFEDLILGGPKSVVEAFGPTQHPNLKERLLGVINVDINASVPTAAAEAAVLQPLARRRRQEKLLANLADNLGPGGQAATGLNQVLAALHEGKVHTLFIRRDHTAPGGLCPDCARLRHVAGPCPLCGQEMTPVSDVVNLALAQALDSGAALEQIEGDSPLDELGRVAALLRYA